MQAVIDDALKQRQVFDRIVVRKFLRDLACVKFIILISGKILSVLRLQGIWRIIPGISFICVRKRKFFLKTLTDKDILNSVSQFRDHTG